jgi:hypothetical protein
MPKEDAATKTERLVDEEVDESFPASDPPSWSGMHIGTPCPLPESDETVADEDCEDAEPADTGA